ncbi:MAG: biotin/lipoyl-binding protein, partial [Pseudomonadota bacterium]|nr:biotin/lipoyl-binding protein [Pseudomonadota bacterium]
MPLDRKSKSILKKLGVLAGVGVFALVTYEIFYWFTHVYEYDARIEAELTTLSSRIDGEIEKVYVKEGDRVKEGDLLVALKANVQRLKIKALEADLVREEGQ